MKKILLTNRYCTFDNAIALGKYNSDGVAAWSGGGHGEELVLRRVMCAALAKCAKERKDIALDVGFFGTLGYKFSYLKTVFDEVISGEAQAYVDSAERAVFYNAPIFSDELLAYGEGLLRPVCDNENLNFIKHGEHISKKFRQYLSENPPESFGGYLMRLAQSKGFKRSSEICMASGISKATMSKLVNDVSKPSKDSLAAIAIGLKLELDEAEELYNRAGYHIGCTDDSDRALRFFIGEEIYDIDVVNYALYYNKFRPLGERPRDDYIEINTDI